MEIGKRNKLIAELMGVPLLQCDPGVIDGESRELQLALRELQRLFQDPARIFGTEFLSTAPQADFISILRHMTEVASFHRVYRSRSAIHFNLGEQANIYTLAGNDLVSSIQEGTLPIKLFVSPLQGRRELVATFSNRTKQLTYGTYLINKGENNARAAEILHQVASRLRQ